ncbi:MAG TPA: 5'/3'-nucleotidase SurE [Hyphomonadaceae bacterium]|nr:stationary phase survival protein SurE [Hyphomonadaceae bacterium UKL13-1]OYU51357.1 MAG: 5'/3'-nucleotidase SurE [Alphaproteobacteria bacterium PA1]HCP65395.1 5'/3'-nucleotidase SurE [Hyphomonadaceae bacterium]
MRILISNDDGIHAPGLAVLERIAQAISSDIWVVAPEVERSGASRALTLTEPVRVRTVGERRFACSGTPTDCVLLGVDELVKGGRPDLVLSGVNRGQNLAEDTSVSGTVAAAVQGMQMGIPSIALSQAVNFRVGQPIPWHTAEAHGADVLRKLLASPWPDGVVMNVNFPDCEPEEVTGLEATFQGFRDECIHQIDRRSDLRGNDYYWIGYRGKLSKPPAGSDLLAIYENRISVSPLHIDMTEHSALGALREVLKA